MPQDSSSADTEQLIALSGSRILVVEDEAIVALALTDLLHELGFEVVGLFGSLSEAANATGTADFDAAILDVNLDGQIIIASRMHCRNGVCLDMVQKALAPVSNILGSSKNPSSAKR